MNLLKRLGPVSGRAREGEETRRSARTAARSTFEAFDRRVVKTFARPSLDVIHFLRRVGKVALDLSQRLRPLPKPVQAVEHLGM
jgi:hypothetical protein